jgi:hypothetical protein
VKRRGANTSRGTSSIALRRAVSRMPLARRDRMKDAAPIASCSSRASASDRKGMSWFIASALHQPKACA